MRKKKKHFAPEFNSDNYLVFNQEIVVPSVQNLFSKLLSYPITQDI